MRRTRETTKRTSASPPSSDGKFKSQEARKMRTKFVGFVRGHIFLSVVVDSRRRKLLSVGLSSKIRRRPSYSSSGRIIIPLIRSNLISGLLDEKERNDCRGILVGDARTWQWIHTGED